APKRVLPRSHDRSPLERNDRYLPADSFLPVGRISLITLGTKVCTLLTAQNGRCDVFATTRNKRGGGAIRKPVPRFVSRIPARKSCSSQFRVNDLTKQNYENEIRIHHHNHRVVAVPSIHT